MNQRIVNDIESKVVNDSTLMGWLINVMTFIDSNEHSRAYHALANLAKTLVNNMSEVERLTRITYATCQVKETADIHRELYVMHRHIVKTNYDKAFVECISCMKALYPQVYQYSE